MEIIKDGCYKGTRILLGNGKQDYIQECRESLKSLGYIEIQIPIIQLANVFDGKVGPENNNMMYNFTDRGGRDICLAPEYTSVIQQLASGYFKHKKDVKVFYVAECFRGEKPQKGRYRQFTQLGVEVINPTIQYNLGDIALSLCKNSRTQLSFELDTGAKRGLDYYNNGKGFEIVAKELGSSKQVCGGGYYDGGVGFAIGIDRLI
tara:strand:- start:429 stop:1043 length:615 start_codon:yes stop_codon:yes gene_type:complete